MSSYIASSAPPVCRCGRLRRRPVPLRPTTARPTPQVPFSSWIPLKKVDVRATISDFNCEVSITQEYHNTESQPIEAEYIFPLDQGAAVCFFSAVLVKAGAEVTGIVKRKEEAKRDYDEAVEAGQTAVLVNQETSEIFRAAVGQLQPQEIIRCTIKYITELKTEGKATRFLLPTTISPRYDCSHASQSNEHEREGQNTGWRRRGGSTSPSPTKSVLNDIKYLEHNAYTLNITADITMPSPITSVRSPSAHGIVVEKTGPSVATVSLTQESPLDKDLVLLIEQKDPFVPRAVFEYLEEEQASQVPMDAEGSKEVAVAAPAPKSLKASEMDLDDTAVFGMSHVAVDESKKSTVSRVAQITFCPEGVDAADASDLRCELIFFVDVSGSMAGKPITSVQRALQIFLRSLPTECIFNIVTFNNSHRRLFEESMAYNDETCERAVLFVNGLQAGGGTELLPALRSVFADPEREGFPRQMFILTDGEVSNTDSVIEQVRRHADTTRVFTFGIGQSVSHALVQGVAEAGNGQCELVVNNDQISEKVMRQLQRSLQPALLNVTVDWSPISSQSERDEPGAPHTHVQVPKKVPHLYAGDRYFVYLLNASSDLPAEGCQIQVEATFSNGGKKTVQIPLDQTKLLRGSLIHKLAARKRINELQHAASSSMDSETVIDLTSESSGAGSIKQEIIDLSLKHSILSNYTSFIAVFKENGRGEGAPVEPMVHRAVPMSSGNESLRSASPQLMGYHSGSRNRHRSQRFAMAVPASASASFVDRSCVDRGFNGGGSRGGSRGGRGGGGGGLNFLLTKGASKPASYSGSTLSSSNWGGGGQQLQQQQYRGAPAPAPEAMKRKKKSSAQSDSVSLSSSSSRSRSRSPTPRREERKDQERDRERSSFGTYVPPAVRRPSSGLSSASSSSSSSSSSASSLGSGSVFDQLVSAQKADGAWALNEQLLAILAKDADQKVAAAAAAQKALGAFLAKYHSLEENARRKVVGTLVALYLLDSQCEADRGKWGLMAGKALKYLSKTLGAVVDSASYRPLFDALIV